MTLTMSRLISASLLVAALTACDGYTDPTTVAERYALARIGDDHLPIAMGPGGTAPFLLGDTLELDAARPREPAPLLRWIQRIQEANGTVDRRSTEHQYAIAGSVLSFDACPIGSFCIAEASLVAAPMDFQIVGDSLYQIISPPFSGKPSVYGKVRRR